MSSKIEDYHPQARAMVREARRQYRAKQRLALREAGLLAYDAQPRPLAVFVSPRTTQQNVQEAVLPKVAEKSAKFALTS